jgi:hypothetical protein
MTRARLQILQAGYVRGEPEPPKKPPADDEALSNGVGQRDADPEPPQPADPDQFTLPVLTARELCDLPDPPEEARLLGDFIVAGNRTIIGAHTGEGKTTLVAGIAKAIVTAGTLLDWTCPTPGRVLVIDAEQGIRSIKKQLRSAALDQSDQVDYITIPDGLKLDQNEQHRHALEQQLGRHPYAMVAADPLYKLHGGDSNDERAAIELMRIFDKWRTDLGFALVVPVHCRKPPLGAKFSMHELFGSTAYLRGAEVVVGLQRIRDGYARLHFFKDRDGELPVGGMWGLLFSREEGFRRDPDAEKKPTAEQVRDLLEADPGITITQLAEEVGVTDRTIRTALKKIGADEVGARAEHAEKGWRLPPDEATP